jgi:D-alanyl-lipoteichoic acid acyltransferase DltB (MBOAT superfamily)
VLTWREIFLYSEQAPLIFSQYIFLFLFTACYGIYLFVYKKMNLRSLYLLAFSLFFYYKTGGIYFWLLVLSTVVDYNLGNAIFRSNSNLKRNFYLVFSLVANLGLLFFFKYSYYVVGLINDAFGSNLKAINVLAVFANDFLGKDYDIYDIVLPVGISFYTFQTLSYTIDVWRRQLEPAKNLIDFGFFVTFFPQLVAGPIVRASEFIPQIYKPFRLTNEDFGKAAFLIMNGLFKKMVISDYISINFVDRVFDDPQLYSGFENLMAVYGYSIQIYCDFSGYSDMAIGLALLMGFHLSLNFNSPYKSNSITDFWRRWHISLSTWLRDYLYIALGGNRKGKIRMYFNLLITMILGGLWHGAATRFIIWGGLHGAALTLHKIWVQYMPFAKKEFCGKNIVMGLITFHFVAFGWIYFRSPDIPHVYQMLNQIGQSFDWQQIPVKIAAYKIVFALILFGFIMHLLPYKWKDKAKQWYIDLPIIVKTSIFALAIVVAYQAASSEIQPFIYFQF